MKLVIYKSGSEYPIEIAAKSTMLHVLLMMRATYPDTFKDKYVKIYKNKKKGRLEGNVKTSQILSSIILGDNPPSVDSEMNTILYAKIYKDQKKCTVM